jgi:hypothetical protein
MNDLGTIVDSRQWKRLHCRDPIDALLVDEQNPLEDPMFLHEVDVGRTWSRWYGCRYGFHGAAFCYEQSAATPTPHVASNVRRDNDA